MAIQDAFECCVIQSDTNVTVREEQLWKTIARQISIAASAAEHDVLHKHVARQHGDLFMLSVAHDRLARLVVEGDDSSSHTNQQDQNAQRIQKGHAASPCSRIMLR